MRVNLARREAGRLAREAGEAPPKRGASAADQPRERYEAERGLAAARRALLNAAKEEAALPPPESSAGGASNTKPKQRAARPSKRGGGSGYGKEIARRVETRL